MDLDYSSPGEVIVSTESYIIEAIDEFPKEMTKTINTPAGNHIFKIDDACVNICKIDRIIFNRLVEKLLFLSKRARPDIQPKIAFLTTGVRNPDDEDWKSLRRVLSYLDMTINSVKLRLNANNLNVVHLWVDASYNTRPYLKEQTWATISIRKGCFTSAFRKQKINATSSTISDLVGVHEASPQL